MSDTVTNTITMACKTPAGPAKQKTTSQLSLGGAIQQLDSSINEEIIDALVLIRKKFIKVVFEPTCADCTVGSYASLSVCLSVRPSVCLSVCLSVWT